MMNMVRSCQNLEACSSPSVPMCTKPSLNPIIPLRHCILRKSLASSTALQSPYLCLSIGSHEGRPHEALQVLLEEPWLGSGPHFL
jgi:hypothetical protein